MTADEFNDLLQGAIAGKHENLETILQLYMPLINHYSTVGGVLDEDLRQYILIRIALNISKFSI